MSNQDSKQEKNQPERKEVAPRPANQRRPGERPGQRIQHKYDTMLTVVIPLLNEEESLPELAIQLENELQDITRGRYEVIFIDDGSTDGSFEFIRQLHERNKKFRAVRFRRNYGKSAALAVGFGAARGRYVATMDADLQDDPAEFRNMIDKMKEGFDLVSGWKKVRHDPISKTLPSKFFNWVTSKVSGIRLHDFNCGIKLYKREVTDRLQVYGEMHRYLPALAAWEGFRVAEIPVKHHARRYGKSKFGLNRFINGFLDILTVVFTTRFLKRPMHFFGSFGTLFTFAGLLVNAYLTFEWAMGRTYLTNRPLTLLGVALIIVGVQFFSIGLIGEMIVKNNYESTKNYSISERL